MSWLEGLKVGDEVVVHGRHKSVIDKITKLTKTQIVVGDMRFNRTTGSKCGNSLYSYAHLAQVTAAVRAEFVLDSKTRFAKRLIEHIVLPTDLEGLKEFIEAIKPYLKKEGS